MEQAAEFLPEVATPFGNLFPVLVLPHVLVSSYDVNVRTRTFTADMQKSARNEDIVANLAVFRNSRVNEHTDTTVAILVIRADQRRPGTNSPAILMLATSVM